jgi:hypothetical protein
MKESEVAELVALLSAAYVRPPVTKATCQLYEQMLKDLDRDIAHKAVARLIATAKWLPSVAEIRAAAVEVQLGVRRSGIDAWGDVLQAQAIVGFKQKSEGAWTPADAPLVSPVFEDATVARCVQRMGGWIAFRDVDSFDRSKFCELYDKLAEDERRDAVAGPSLALSGRSDAALPAKRGVESVPGFSAIGQGGKG